MTQKFTAKLKQISFGVVRNITTNRARRRVIERFASKNRMIYFGAVDQKKDDHKLIRGATSSSTHFDNHFAVGTVDDYDVSLVDRSDVCLDINKKSSFNEWFIVCLEMKNGAEVPHIFIGANNHEAESYEKLFISESTFSRVKLGTFENYPEDFISRFFVYCPARDIIETQKLFPASSSRVLGAHLWPHSVEIKDGYVYIYAKNDKITQNTLTNMLNIGLWIARHLDYMIEQV
jgi:hypothetical protein